MPAVAPFMGASMGAGNVGAQAGGAAQGAMAGVGKAMQGLNGLGGPGMMNKLGGQLQGQMQQKGMTPGQGAPGMAQPGAPDMAGEKSLGGDKSMGADAGLASPGAAQGMGQAIGSMIGNLSKPRTMFGSRGMRGGRR